MYAKIFLKPTRSIEFIAIDFVITNSGAAFDPVIVTFKADNEFKPFVSISGSYNTYLSDTDSKQNFQGQTSGYVTKIDKNNWMSGSIKTGFVKHTDNKESYLVVGYKRSYKEKDLYLQLGLSIDF